MTIQSPDQEKVEALREVAVVTPKVYEDGVFRLEIPHPHDGLVVRVEFDGDQAIIDLFNQSESLAQECVSVSGDLQAELQSGIESIYSGWRKVVL
jgi:hypothetical protein